MDYEEGDDLTVEHQLTLFFGSFFILFFVAFLFIGYSYSTSKHVSSRESAWLIYMMSVIFLILGIILFRLPKTRGFDKNTMRNFLISTLFVLAAVNSIYKLFFDLMEPTGWVKTFHNLIIFFFFCFILASIYLFLKKRTNPNIK